MKCDSDKTILKLIFVRSNVEGVAMNFEVDSGEVYFVI